MRKEEIKVESLMANIDAVSHKLGKLEANQEDTLKHLSSISRKQDNLLDEIKNVHKFVENAHYRINMLEPDVRKAKAGAEDWIRTKFKAKWIITGASITGLFAGSALGKAITKLFGWI